MAETSAPVVMPPAGPLRGLFGRGAWYTGARVLQVAAGVLALPVLTRLLPADEFGVVTTSLVVWQLVRLLGDLGLSAAVTLAFFQRPGRDDPARLVTSAVASSIVVALVAHVTGPWWSQAFGEVDYGASLTWAVWATVPFTMLMAAQSLLQAQERVRAFVASAAVATVCAQGLGLVLAAGSGPDGYLAGIFFGYVAAGALAWWSSGAASRPAGRDLLRWAIPLALPTLPHAVSLVVLQLGDRLVIERVEGLESVGRYQVAYLVGTVGFHIIGGINSAWSPIIYGTQEADRWRVLTSTTGAVLRLAGLLAAVTALLSPLAIALAADADYDRAGLVTIASVVAVSLVPFVVYLSSVHVLFTRARAVALAWVTPLSAALNIGLNVWLVPRHGLIGAAVATVVAYVVQAGLVTLAARRLVVVPWDRAAVASAVVIAGAGAGLGVALGEDGPALAVRVALATVLVVAAGLSLRRLLVREGLAEAVSAA